METMEYDVVVIGCGVAGLYGALQFPDDVRVLAISKRELECSNTSFAQGGVACVLDLENDSYDLHIQDTMIAGKNANRLEAVEVLVHEGPQDVLNLENYGVTFDRDENNEFKKTLEGGHCRHRIVYHHDFTGKAIADGLIESAIMKPNIDVISNTKLFSLKKVEGGFVVGILSYNKPFKIKARYVLLATGGIGRVYPYTTNSAIATGDGIMFAYELGAKIEHLNWVQFHPTAFACSQGRERFLISESVRGEGAHLLNAKKRTFTHKYDKRGDLAPRDVVAEAIYRESLKQGSEEIYLDIRYKDPDFVKERFPMIYERCLHEGIDITRDLIPVFPCQHYLMGGIDVDLNAQTSVDGLYAAGECSHTGVHGKNRLASNSLLEGLVFSRRAATDITRRLKENPQVKVADCDIRDVHGATCPKGFRTEIRKMVYDAHFIIKKPEKFQPYLDRINEIIAILKSDTYDMTGDYIEILSLATVAKIILEEDIAENEA